MEDKRKGGGAIQGLLYPLIVFVLSQLIGPVLSGVSEGRILIPASVTYTFAGLALVWAAVVGVNKIAAQKRRRTTGPGIYIGPGMATSVRRVKEITYAGVKWIIESWHGPFEFSDLEPDNSLDRNLHVATPPRCPECGTELEERQKFWGSWTYACPACSFAVVAQKNFELEAMRVQKLARREIEKQLGK